MSSQMVFPLLPLFLALELGADKWMIGLIRGFAEFTSSVLKPFSGKISDKIGKRKGIIFIGYALAAMVKPAFSLAKNWIHVLGMRISERVGKGIRVAPRDALVSELAVEGHTALAYGVQRSLDAAGKVSGALLLFLLFSVMGLGFRKLFLIAGIPAAIAAILVLSVKEPEKKVHGEHEVERAHRLAGGVSAELKFFIAIAAIFSLGNYTQDFILLRGLNMGISINGVIFSNVVFFSLIVVTAQVAGDIADKIGRLPLIFVAFLCFIVTTVVLMMASDLLYYLVAFAIFGIFYGIWDSIPRAFVADIAGEKKGLSFGLYHMAVGLSMLPGVMIAGYLWDLFGPRATFLYALTLSTTALIMLLAYYSFIFKKR